MTEKKEPLPNSPEWIQEVSRRNLTQGMAAMAAVEKSGGKIAVCSICGDEPAPIYRGHHLPKRDLHPRLIRLCGDCLKIRRTLFEDEDFRREDEHGN